MAFIDKGKSMRVLGLILVCVFALSTMGCGGEDAYGTGSSSSSSSSSSSGGGSPTVSSLSLLTSKPSLGSSSTDSVTLSAIVKDGNNRLMEGVDVVFSSDGGALDVPSPTTSATGVATAKLSTAGDPRNRTIRITAMAGGQTATVDVPVSGTALTVNGANSLVMGSSTDLTIFLKDSGNTGIPRIPVTVTSAKGNTLSASSVTTESSGQARVTVTGTQDGIDTITVSALGASATFSISVSSDQFSFTAPSASDLNIGVDHAVSVTWNSGGSPVNGQPVNFSATRGTLSATSANTNASGVASITVRSNNAGPTIITASTTSGPSASITREFVATTPATLNLQMDKATIGINGDQATLTAILRDTAGNLVKGKTVRFSILADLSGGSLSNATAITDSQGKASTVYTSTSASTAKDGVKIQAKFDDTSVTCPAIPAADDLCDEKSLTVAQSKAFVKLGGGNKIEEHDATRYRYPYSVLVTDAAGNPITGTDVVITLIPTRWYRGSWVWDDVEGTYYADYFPDPDYPEGGCPNEDVNLDGILQDSEDANDSGSLEPRNVASVETKVSTDQYGFGIMNIVYAKEYGHWADVRLTAAVSVNGTESISSVEFKLPVLAADLKKEGSPPGLNGSPFGSGLCGDWP